MRAHTHAHTNGPKQMSPKRACRPLSNTHTYILQQQRFQQESCQLSEIFEGTDHHLSLISSSRAKRASLSNWSHLHIRSHLSLNWSLSGFFFSRFVFCFRVPLLFLFFSFVFDLSAPYSAQLPQGVSDRQALLPMAPKWRRRFTLGVKQESFCCQPMFVLLADRN